MNSLFASGSPVVSVAPETLFHIGPLPVTNAQMLGLLGMGNARQRRTGQAVPRAIFASVGVLSFAAAGVAVLW